MVQPLSSPPARRPAPSGHSSRHHTTLYAQNPAATPVHTKVATTGLRDDDKSDYMTAYLPDYHLSLFFVARRIDPYLAHLSMSTPTPLGHSPACLAKGSHALTLGYGRTCVLAPVCAQPQETLRYPR